MPGSPSFQADQVAWLCAGSVSGLLIGSFLGTILTRWPEGRSVLAGRSRCDGCRRTLRPVELVPVLAYVASGGRCRDCGSAIDGRHFMAELGCGLIGLLAFAVQGGASGIAAAILGWWLFLLAALDVEHHWLPDRLTLPLAPAGLLVAVLGIGPPLPDRLIGAAAGFAILLGLAFAYRRLRLRDGMGAGDPKLLAAIGAWLGWQALPLLMMAAGLVGLAALLLMRMEGRTVTASSRLPLGALMALPAWAMWLAIA